MTNEREKEERKKEATVAMAVAVAVAAGGGGKIKRNEETVRHLAHKKPMQMRLSGEHVRRCFCNGRVRIAVRCPRNCLEATPSKTYLHGVRTTSCVCYGR